MKLFASLHLFCLLWCCFWSELPWAHSKWKDEWALLHSLFTANTPIKDKNNNAQAQAKGLGVGCFLPAPQKRDSFIGRGALAASLRRRRKLIPFNSFPQSSWGWMIEWISSLPLPFKVFPFSFEETASWAGPSIKRDGIHAAPRAKREHTPRTKPINSINKRQQKTTFCLCVVDYWWELMVVLAKRVNEIDFNLFHSLLSASSPLKLKEELLIINEIKDKPFLPLIQFFFSVFQPAESWLSWEEKK